LIAVRAQEYSGVWEELKTSGINKEKYYRKKEVAASTVVDPSLLL
jgi:hypothetical protein